jgi:copper chaperone CopZ
MISIREGILRCNLKPRVESDLPGRLRMIFPRYALLPDSAMPYIHYVEDVLKLLPGVRTVRVNTRIGTVLVLYDQAVCTTRQILRWVDIVVDTGIEIAQELESAESKNEKDIASVVRQRLVLRLPQCRESKKTKRRSEKC